MKKNSLKYLAGLIAVSTLALAGCSNSDQANKEQPIGMANPAAVYCEEHGSYDLQSGQCTLKSGEMVDAGIITEKTTRKCQTRRRDIVNLQVASICKIRANVRSQTVKLWMPKATSEIINLPAAKFVLLLTTRTV